MSKNKERLDKLLIESGLVKSRSKAQAVIMAGEVLVNGEPVTKAGQQIPREAALEIVAPMPYVSRGGYKLANALKVFGIDVADLICADVGACTGGFTDVLLQNGAERVYAIDVGYGQLDWKLRTDERVVVLERTNARYLDELPESVEFVAIDVSFISLRLILPAVYEWLAPGANIVALVKPQFEAGREFVGKGGVIRDPAVHRQVLTDLIHWTVGGQMAAMEIIRSPIVGSSGNVEFLLWLAEGQGSDASFQRLIDSISLTTA